MVDDSLCVLVKNKQVSFGVFQDEIFCKQQRERDIDCNEEQTTGNLHQLRNGCNDSCNSVINDTVY